jgi:ATP-dependent DNA helicase RecQ
LTDKGWAVLKGEETAAGHLLPQATITAPEATARYDPALFQQLRAERKTLADVDGVPPYVIFSDRALQEMATYFPHSAASFGQIHGIGQVKVTQYADIFLPLIRDYCAANGLVEKPKLTGSAPVPARTRLGRSRADEVGEAFQAGQSLDELMATFGIKRSTILSHLNNYVQQGQTLPIEPLQAASTLAADGQTAVLEIFAALGADRLAPVFAALDGQVSYEELHLLRLIYRLQAGQGA